MSSTFVVSGLDAVAVPGDAHAFERLYEATFPLVWAFASRRAATRAKAEEITEAILERAFATPPTRGEEDAWLAAVFAIAREVQVEDGIPAP